MELVGLALLMPCLLLDGYGALVVPIGIGFLWAIEWALTGQLWPRSDLTVPIATLVALTVLSPFITRGEASWAIPKVSTLIFGIALYVAAIRWHQAGLPARSVLGFMVGVCAAFGLVALVGTGWPSKVGVLTEVTSQFPRLLSRVGPERGFHPNAVAGTLLLLLPLCVPVLSRAWRGATWAIFAAAVTLGLASVVLVLSQSRGGWLGAVAALVVFGWYRVPPKVRRYGWLFMLVAGSACAAMAAWMMSSSVTWVGADLGEKWLARVEMWRLGVLFIGDYPWTGVGFNGFRHLATELYTSDYQTYGRDIAHPHNMWLSVGVDLGVLGIAAYLALWVIASRRLLRVAFGGAPVDRVMARALFASWAGFWVFGMTDAIPLGTKLGTVLWPALALGQMLVRPALHGGTVEVGEAPARRGARAPAPAAASTPAPPPTANGDEVLQRLVAPRIAEPPMHGLHGLPLAVVEDRVEILTGRRALRRSIETVGELVGKLAEPSQQRAGRRFRHAPQRTQLSAFV